MLPLCGDHKQILLYFLLINVLKLCFSSFHVCDSWGSCLFFCYGVILGLVPWGADLRPRLGASGERGRQGKGREGSGRARKCMLMTRYHWGQLRLSSTGTSGRHTWQWSCLRGKEVVAFILQLCRSPPERHSWGINSACPSSLLFLQGE